VFVVGAAVGRFGAFFAQYAELLFPICQPQAYWGVNEGRDEKGEKVVGMCIPLLSTACHSSFDFWTGYDMLSDAGVEELKRELRNGIAGMDLRIVAREIGEIVR